jgi:hypothetical protein
MRKAAENPRILWWLAKDTLRGTLSLMKKPASGSGR